MTLQKLLDTNKQNILQNILFSYTKKKKINKIKTKTKIKETNWFTIVTRKIKFMGINLLMQRKDFWAKSIKVWIKQIKCDTTEDRVIPFFGLEDCEDGYTAKILCIQCNSYLWDYQWHFYRTRKKHV